MTISKEQALEAFRVVEGSVACEVTHMPDAALATLRSFIEQQDDQDAKDAARYRWLCEQDNSDRLFIAHGGSGPWGECGHGSFGGFKELADSAIDAALQSSTGSNANG